MEVNLDSLLLALVGKDKKKRDKVLQCFDSLEYDDNTRVYKVRSVTKAGEFYKVIFQKAKGEWFCNCPAVNYFKYYRYQNLEARKKAYRKKGCIHVLACRLYNVINRIDVKA